MTPLDACYARLLQLGFVVLRQAIESGNHDWIEAELVLLHNLPSLLGESNVERHRCFWFLERVEYMNWVRGQARNEPISRMRTYYEPIWEEMEPLIANLKP